jgi:hypothetical protein
VELGKANKSLPQYFFSMGGVEEIRGVLRTKISSIFRI